MIKNSAKGSGWIAFGLSLAILSGDSFQTLAQQQFERYPTAAELQRLREEFRQKIRSLESNGNVSNIRSIGERQRRAAFVRAWSRVDRTVAPFLGDWSGYEEDLAIYPSNTRGRVCLIYIAPQEAELSFGNVSGGEIKNDGSVIIKEGDYLGIVVVTNNRASIPVEAPYNSPGVLQSARDFARRSATTASEVEEVVAQFNAAGCRDSLPSRR